MEWRVSQAGLRGLFLFLSNLPPPHRSASRCRPAGKRKRKRKRKRKTERDASAFTL
jgi:hypothetical protein